MGQYSLTWHLILCSLFANVRLCKWRFAVRLYDSMDRYWKWYVEQLEIHQMLSALTHFGFNNMCIALKNEQITYRLRSFCAASSHRVMPRQAEHTRQTTVAGTFWNRVLWQLQSSASSMVIPYSADVYIPIATVIARRHPDSWSCLQQSIHPS